jgi:hypothetical protein
MYWPGLIPGDFGLWRPSSAFVTQISLREDFYETGRLALDL